MPNTIPSGQLIKLLHDRLERHANNTLRGKDLTMMQVAVLMELQEAEQKQRSMKELERKFCVAQSTVAGIISRLEQKGFVDRRKRGNLGLLCRCEKLGALQKRTQILADICLFPQHRADADLLPLYRADRQRISHGCGGV